MDVKQVGLKGIKWCVLVAVLASLLAFAGAQVFEVWEYIFLDWHLKNTSVSYSSQKLALILGGDRSIAELDSWPWPREVHAELINDKLAGAKAVGFDIILTDKTTREQDDALAQAIAKNGNVVLGSVYQSDGSLLQPLDMFLENAQTGYFNFSPDEDYVVRRYPLVRERQEDGYSVLSPSFVHSMLYASGYEPLVTPAKELSLTGGQTLGLDENFNVFKLPVNEDVYSVYEYVDVLKGRVPADAFEDAVVFVGISATGASDNVHTSTGYLAGTQVLADLYCAVLAGYMPKSPPVFLQILYMAIAFAVCFIGALLLPGRVNWLPLVLTAIALPLSAHLLFVYAGVYYASAAACFTLILCGVLQLFYLRIMRENRQKRKMLMNMITSLVAAIDAKDPVTAGHSQRVSDISVQIARKKGLSRKETENIRLAGLIHDIGKIGIADAVLNKPGKYTPEEFTQMKEHPKKGYAIMKHAGLSEAMLSGILDHHERQDGKGYPNGKKAGELSVYAEIIKIADVYDALVSKRQYKEPWPMEKVCDTLLKGRENEFNAELIDLFLQDTCPSHWSLAHKNESLQE